MQDRQREPPAFRCSCSMWAVSANGTQRTTCEQLAVILSLPNQSDWWRHGKGGSPHADSPVRSSNCYQPHQCRLHADGIGGSNGDPQPGSRCLGGSRHPGRALRGAGRLLIMGRYWPAELWPTQGDAVPYVVARRNISRASRLAGAAGPARWRRALGACRASRSRRSRSPARRASSWRAFVRYSWMVMTCSLAAAVILSWLPQRPPN